MLLQTLTMLTESTTLTWLNHLVIWGSLLVYFVVSFILTAIPQDVTYTIFIRMLSSPAAYFSIFVCIGARVAMPFLVLFDYWSRFTGSHVCSILC